MSAKDVLKNIDKGFYHDARKHEMTPNAYLAQQVNPEEPETDKVFKRLCKRFQVADDDSHAARSLWDFARETAALQKCFVEAGIKARGRHSDTMEKAFFSSANNTALFPVFFANQIIMGVLASSLVPFLSAMEESINSHVAQKITMTETSADRTLKFAGEGVALPKMKISTSEGNVTLYKYGRMLEASYEALRLQHLDVVGNHMQRVGLQIGIDETDDLIETLIAGDGTSGSAVTDTDAEVAGTLDYDELVRLYQAFPIGYSGNHAVINDTNLRTILNMPEFKDPNAGFNFTRQGVSNPEIFGATYHRWTSTGSTSFSTDRILTVDGRYAVKILTEGDLLEESDNLIDRQINRRAMSYWKGYMKLDNNATQCLDIS